MTRPTNKQITQWMDNKFTKKQLEIYKLVHPDLGGLSVNEAAKELNITIQAAYTRLANMKKRYPPAFRYETIRSAVEEQISSSYKKPNEIPKLSRIIARSKQMATKSGIPYNLSDDDYLDIVRNPCFVCDREGEHNGITSDGRHFKYNYLILRTFEEGFHYCNVYPICDRCKGNQSWRELQRFNRMGF